MRSARPASSAIAASWMLLTRRRSSTTSSAGASSTARVTCSASAKPRSPCSSNARAACPLARDLRRDGRGALTLGRQLGQRERPPHRRRTAAGVFEHVQVQRARKLLADTNAADRVASIVQRRREDADAELAGEHGDHASGDAALGRKPDVVEPVARRVVHPRSWPSHSAHHARCPATPPVAR